VVTTELEPAKVKRAREHLEEAGLLDHVENREGDALETLRTLDGTIDLMRSRPAMDQSGKAEFIG
jgi:predicted O-methyltransferase YrrM